MCADFRDVFDLVKAAEVIDFKVIVLEDGPLPDLFVLLSEPDARGEGRKFEKTISVEFFFILGEAIKHLGRAL